MCKNTMSVIKSEDKNVVCKKHETIHSGHFMVSHFEAEAQDDEYEIAVPVPEDFTKKVEIIPIKKLNQNGLQFGMEQKMLCFSIETSLTKLFQCMTIAYRQKLTSPKWNRFKGVRLRWKDKIRLNNVIWRCWHMQFITKKSTSVCQFASPLDVDIHNKPEAVVLEGKYWKRKLNAVTAEYKKWRLFYRNQILGSVKDNQLQESFDFDNYYDHMSSGDSFDNFAGNLMVDGDYLELMSDTLFSSISANQPFAFPDTREIARGASLADFIQPSLVQLQPNLDDFMDTLEPLQELLSSSTSKLPSVPEEYQTSDDLYRSLDYDEASSLSYFPMESTKGNFSINHNSNQTHDFNNGYESNESSLIYNNSHDNTYANIQQQTYSQQQQQQQLSYALNYTQQRQSYDNQYEQPFNTSSYNIATHQQHSQQLQNQSYAKRGDGGVINQITVNQTKLNASPTNNELNARNDEKFAIPKTWNVTGIGSYKDTRMSCGNHCKPFLSQHGRSRSGSNLQSHNNARTQQLCPSLIDTQEPVASALLTQLLASNKNPGNYATGSYNNLNNNNCDSKYNTIATYRPIAHCTALVGRRSRTPDHVLCSTSNPVGYCKPRISTSRSHCSSETCSYDTQKHRKSFLYENSRTRNTPYDRYSITSQSQQSTFPLSSSLPSPYTFSNGLQTNQIVTPSSSFVGHSASSSPGQAASPTTSESLSLSPLTVGSPVRTTTSPSTKSITSATPYKEHRRVCHINAEQKRRCNIKNGFDTLHMLIPQLAQNPNTKMSKAAMLQKGAEYIRQLRNERCQLNEEMDTLKQQVETLNCEISNCQSLLPATGAPISRNRSNKMKEMFDEYVKERTKQNWKFWILSLICEPLLNSFNSSVSTASVEELFRTTIQWTEQHCSLVDLRPIVLNALRQIGTRTDILSDPNNLPEQARTAALSRNNK